MMRAEFEKQAEILRKWQKSVNLVSSDSLDNLENRHFADSAQLADYIPRDTKLIDMGSGAGFPGVVLAILGYDVTCVESDQKKCAFLSELKRELNLDNLEIINDRIENFIKNTGVFDKNTVPARARITNLTDENISFTARAFAPLPKIMKILSETGQKHRLFALKGRKIEDEISRAKRDFLFDYEIFPSKTGDGYVVIIDFIGKK